MAAVVTAAAVFGVGMLVLPPVEPPAPVVLPPPPPPPVPAPAPEAGATDALGDAQPDTVPDVKPEVEPAKPEPAVAQATTKPEPPGAHERPGDHERPADHDIARDAWRKNLPDISTEPGKSSMLIPIKGSIEGATYHVTVKPRSVLVTLPKAESMITMPFYSVRHDGFRQLWIKKDETTGVTVMRIVLGEATDPQAEIKDDFVRVTVKRLEGAPAPSAAAPPRASPSPAAPPPAEASPPPAPARD